MTQKGQDNTKAWLVIAASICFLVTFFEKPLHMPAPWKYIPEVVGVALIGLVFYLNKRKQTPNVKRVESNAAYHARKRYFWIISISLFIGFFGPLPWMPYLIDNFKTSLYYIVVPVQIAVFPFIIWFFWKKIVEPFSPKR